MLTVILVALVLVAVTVSVHALGLSLLLRALTKSITRPPTNLWTLTGILIRLIWWLILIHVVEIAVWGIFYSWQGCLPDAESSFYFAGVTYTTVGYGDLVLPKEWRMLGPVEGLTGILMCALSGGLVFAVVSRMVASRVSVDVK